MFVGKGKSITMFITPQVHSIGQNDSEFDIKTHTPTNPNDASLHADLFMLPPPHYPSVQDFPEASRRPLCCLNFADDNIYPGVWAI